MSYAKILWKFHLDQHLGHGFGLGNPDRTATKGSMLHAVLNEWIFKAVKCKSTNSLVTSGIYKHSFFSIAVRVNPTAGAKSDLRYDNFLPAVLSAPFLHRQVMHELQFQLLMKAFDDDWITRILLQQPGWAVLRRPNLCRSNLN